MTIGKDGADRIRDTSGTYVARYRDGNGIVVEVSTGCRDKTAAESVLADLTPSREGSGRTAQACRSSYT